MRLAEFDSSVPPPERRDPPPSVNGRILEAILRHRHHLLRVENGVVGRLIAPLREAEREIRSQLLELANREGALSDFQRIRQVRLRELEERIRAALSFAVTRIGVVARSEFREVAAAESRILSHLLAAEVPPGITIDLWVPNLPALELMVNQPLGGKLWADRLRANYGELALGMQRSLATSITLGEGIAPATRRLSRVARTVGRSRLTLIARSEIQRVANSAAQTLYRANQDIVSGVQVVGTLDGRTCLVCAAEDGRVHPADAPDGRLPPFHPACRCFTTPVIRSWEQLGIDPLTMPPGTRASMDGQVPASVNYEDWFGRQPASFQRRALGPTRYELFRSGQLRVTEFQRDLRVLRVDELPEAA